MSVDVGRIYRLFMSKQLLSEYQPKIIKTEVENEEALLIVEQLMHLQRSDSRAGCYLRIIGCFNRKIRARILQTRSID